MNAAIALVGDHNPQVTAQAAIPLALDLAGETAGLRFTGFDAAGQVRAGKLPTHPFFFVTLFQPERPALRGEWHPLITAFVRTASAAASRH
jgi:CTP synthase (UTP-ammonia lyase)